MLMSPCRAPTSWLVAVTLGGTNDSPKKEEEEEERLKKRLDSLVYITYIYSRWIINVSTFGWIVQTTIRYTLSTVGYIGCACLWAGGVCVRAKRNEKKRETKHNIVTFNRWQSKNSDFFSRLSIASHRETLPLMTDGKRKRAILFFPIGLTYTELAAWTFWTHWEGLRWTLQFKKTKIQWITEI